MSKTATILIASATSLMSPLNGNGDSRWAAVNLTQAADDYAELKELHCVDLAEQPIILTRDQSRSLRKMMKDPNAGPKLTPRLLPMRN